MAAEASLATIIGTGSVWFASSAVLSTWANTAFLNHFGDPILHTLIRFFGSAVFGGVSFQMSEDCLTIDEFAVLLDDVFRPAILLWVANCANSVALKAAGVTLTYVVKASIPVFTVLVCALQGQKFSSLTYCSLIPICVGVGLASGSDMYFSYLGLCAALISALAQTFMNLSIKRVRSKKGHSGSKAFLGMAVLCTVFTIPVAYSFSILPNYGYSQFSPTSFDHMISIYHDSQRGLYWPFILLLTGAVAYHVEYALNFVFVGFVSSVTFSVCDIARRIAIIITGAVVFNKILTANNWIGICIALGGVLWYSYLESQSHQTSSTKSGAAGDVSTKALVTNTADKQLRIKNDSVAKSNTPVKVLKCKHKESEGSKTSVSRTQSSDVIMEVDAATSVKVRQSPRRRSTRLSNL